MAASLSHLLRRCASAAPLPLSILRPSASFSLSSAWERPCQRCRPSIATRFRTDGVAPMVTVTKTSAATEVVGVVDGDGEVAEKSSVTSEEGSMVGFTGSDVAMPPTAAIDAEEQRVTVTASCAARVLELASKRADADSVYLRVYVDAGGCSGFQYKFEIVSEQDGSEVEGDVIDEEEDIVFDRDGARVVIDRASLDFIEGSSIDFVREMIRSSFAVLENPQSESACGCGSSFAIKNFETNPALD